jgi:hypothetical protein
MLVLVHRSARELRTNVQTHSENTGIGARGVNLGSKVRILVSTWTTRSSRDERRRAPPTGPHKHTLTTHSALVRPRRQGTREAQRHRRIAH